MRRSGAAQKVPPPDTPHCEDREPDKKRIRAFHWNVPEAELDDLPAPINEPERDMVFDESQAAQLATIEELPNYWATTDDDSRKREAKLNALPQFIPEIDGLDILLIACVVFLLV